MAVADAILEVLFTNFTSHMAEVARRASQQKLFCFLPESRSNINPNPLESVNVCLHNWWLRPPFCFHT
ncbi:hypothetical protein L1887_01844 [Cichorium endivia]|nr:hypothetical protein L1887_01844 [Cichorium endivia]